MSVHSPSPASGSSATSRIEATPTTSLVRRVLGDGTRWLRASLGARVLALFLGLLFIVQLASFTALQASLRRHARSSLPERLEVSARVLQSLLDRQTQSLAEGAGLLAADAQLIDALQNNNGAAMNTVLRRHAQHLGASEAAWITTGLELRTSASRDPQALAALISRMSRSALGGGRASQIALVSGRPHQFVMVPVQAPWRAGWVLLGAPLDDRLADDLRSLSAAGVTLLSRSLSMGDTWSSDFSSLDAQQTRALASHHWPAPQAAETLTLGTEEYSVYPMWLGPADIHSPHGAVLAVLSLSVDQAVALPRDVQSALITITLLGFIAFSVFGVLSAQRFTMPLRRLAAAAGRLGAGDYSTPVTARVRGDDELGHLAQAFEHMRISVAEKQAQILQLAYRDNVTGLPNRAHFRDAVQVAIVQAQAQTQTQGPREPSTAAVSVIMLDLNRFKQVNEVLGYRFGDMLLTCVAERLSQHSVRGVDLVARLGGDEFAVLLSSGDIELARQVAERIEHAFDAPLSLEEHTVDMSAGIGVACWPQHASDADLLLSRAELAMYHAKRRGSGPLVYEPSIDMSCSQTLSLLGELRQAVGEGQLRLYLQPKLSLDTGEVVGAEALLRWQHPQRGLLPPLQFIPFAEQTGFIRSITLWVFEEAAQHWRMLQGQGLQRMTLSVNLSTRDLLDAELPKKFDALLVKHRVPAEAFCLEITESAMMDDPQRAQATLDRLSALGFKLSIDDFGSGYSSLAYLKRLPVDELKIDKSFVLSMESNTDDAKIVRSTIDLAHNLGLSVVAEGVENGTVWDMLRDLNCDQAQGFHMGRPMLASEFAAWSTAWRARRQSQGLEQRPVLH